MASIRHPSSLPRRLLSNSPASRSTLNLVENAIRPTPLRNKNCIRRSPLVSNSATRRLISWRLRRFGTLASPISVMPTVHQKHAPSAGWVALTDTPGLNYSIPKLPGTTIFARRTTTLSTGSGRRTSAPAHLSDEQKAAIALEWSEQIQLSPDPEKNRRRGRPKVLASRHGCCSSLDLAGRTAKQKLPRTNFS